MAEVKAFRWKGPGDLHLKALVDGHLVVIPPYIAGEIEKGCIVNVEKYRDLDQARIQSFFKEGQAEPVRWTDDVMNFIRPDATASESMTLDDAKKSEDHLQPTVQFEQFVADQTAEIAKKMSPTEKATAEHELRKMGAAATAKVAQGGAIAGGPKAGPDVG